MKCPKCEGKLMIIDTRNAPFNETRRRRECMKCGYRFSTYEMTDVARAKMETQRVAEIKSELTKKIQQLEEMAGL